MRYSLMKMIRFQQGEQLSWFILNRFHFAGPVTEVIHHAQESDYVEMLFIILDATYCSAVYL